MRQGRPVSIWYKPDELSKVEEAAALAGYAKLSTYIRHRSLGRPLGAQAPHGDSSGWGAWGDWKNRFAQIEATQKNAEALLSMLLLLAGKRATTGEITDLVVACEVARAPSEMLGGLRPELASALARLTERAG